MLSEVNPNPGIRSSTRTALRRVVFRPWVKSLLSRCFEKFSVGFWGNGSGLNLDDVLPTVLGSLKGVNAAPLFTWSGKHVEGEDFVDGGFIGKQLELVYAGGLVFVRQIQ